MSQQGRGNGWNKRLTRIDIKFKVEMLHNSEILHHTRVPAVIASRYPAYVQGYGRIRVEDKAASPDTGKLPHTCTPKERGLLHIADQ